MSVFTEKEISYPAEQALGRLATADRNGGPHVVPVSFQHNPQTDTIEIGGHNPSGSKKFRDVAASGGAAFVVDDVGPPWRPRGVEVRGRAEVLPRGGRGINTGFDEEVIRIHSRRIVGRGIETDAGPNARSVNRDATRA